MLLLDKNKNKIRLLKEYSSLTIESTLSTGDKVLSFYYPAKDANDINEEYYIRTQTDEYTVKEIEQGDKLTKFVAVLNIEGLQGKTWERFTNAAPDTVENTINLILVGTGYSVTIHGSITKKRLVSKNMCSSWDLLQEIKKIFRVEFIIDTINKKVNVYEKIGTDKGVYFMDELNVKKLTTQRHSHDFCTKLIAYGKDTLKVEVTNNTYSNKVLERVWKDERYTVEADLREDAQAKLDELAKPRYAYKVDIIDLAKINNVYNILSYSLGDTITLVSNKYNIREKQRIVKTTEYPDEPYKNTAEISNALLTFEDLQKEFSEATDTVSNITQDNYTISENALHTPVNNIITKTINVNEVNSIIGRFGALEASVAHIQDLNAVNAIIEDLKTIKAEITDLEALNAKIKTLEGQTASFETTLSHFLSAGSTQTLHLTAGNVVFDNAVVKSAAIESLALDKLQAGNIDAHSVGLQGKDGHLLIKDNTITINDVNRPRVQIGEDAQHDYNIYIWDAAGNLMFDGKNGIHADAVKSGIIRNDMVADNANIAASKLDRNSLFTVLNADGTQTLKSSIIHLDDKNQTLDVAFNSLTTKVDNIKVGGRNLLRGTKLFILDTNNINGFKDITGGKLTINTVEGYGVATIENSGLTSESWARLSSNQLGLQTGDVVTISMYVKIGDVAKWDRKTIASMDIYTGDTRKAFDIVAENENAITVNEKWYYITKTFTIDVNNVTRSNLNLYLAKNGKISFKKCKLEKGTLPTDYTEAPEDLETDLHNLQTSFNVANGKIEELIKDTTIIHGDGTTTKLIDAYNHTVTTLDSIHTEIGRHETDLTDVKAKLENEKPLQSNLLTSNTVTNTKDNFSSLIAVEGNTLHNLMPTYAESDVVMNTGGGSAYFKKDVLLIEPNKTYTIMFYNLPNDVGSCYLREKTTPIVNGVAKITFNNTLTGLALVHIYPKSGGAFTSTLETLAKIKIVILEGEHDIMPYFEGVKSFEASEFKSIGKNLLYLTEDTTVTNGSNTVKKIGDIFTINGTWTGDEWTTLFPKVVAGTSDINRIDYPLKAGKYTLSVFKLNGTVTGTLEIVLEIVFIDNTVINYNATETTKNTFTLSKDVKQIRLWNHKGNGFKADNVTFKIQLEQGDATTYEQSKQYVYQKTPPLTLHKWDAVDVEGNKTNGTGIYNFTGGEPWIEGSVAPESGNRKLFCLKKDFFNIPIYNDNAYSYIICNSFATSESMTCWTRNYDCIAVNPDSTWHLQILVSPNIATSVDTFKAWLKANKTTIHYKLKDPIKEFIQPIRLNTFNPNTHYFNNSIIPPTALNVLYATTSQQQTYFNYLTEVANAKDIQGIKNIRIGARNLLLNSGFLYDLTHWTGYNTSNVKVIDEVKSVSGKAVQFTSTNDNGGIYQRTENNTPFESNVEYTISGYVRSITGAGVKLKFTPEGAGVGVFETEIAQINTWYKINFTFTNKGTDYHTNSFYANAANATLELIDLQLEKGTISTDYRPAEKDTQIELEYTKSKLNDLVSDDKLTPNEKQELRRTLQIITDEHTKYVTEAAAHAVETTVYNEKFGTLESYLKTITNNLITTDDINIETYKANFNAYYNARTDLLNNISTNLKKETQAVSNALSATNAKITTLEAEAAAAKAAAEAAKTSIADIINDSKLTPNEKQELKRTIDVITAEHTKIMAEATTHGINTEAAAKAYDTAYTNLNTYITPYLTNLTTTENITPNDYKTNFQTYYNSKVDILNAITNKLKNDTNTLTSKVNTFEQEITPDGIIQKVNHAINNDAQKIETEIYTFNKDGATYQHTTNNTYTLINNEGMQVKERVTNPNDPNDHSKDLLVASYRTTANVPEQHSHVIYSDTIFSPDVGRRVYATATVYVSAGGSGDLSGKDDKNCCQSIKEALRILLNGANHYNGTAGIVVKNGTYTNADYDVYIQDLHGIGDLQIYFEANVTYRGRIVVDTCTKYISIYSDAKTPLNTRGGMIFPTGPAPCIDVIASRVKVSGLMLHVNETDHDESTGVRASRGALVEVGDCDIWVVRAALTAYGVGTKIWAYDLRGSTMHYIGIILDTAHIDYGWRVPKNNHEGAADEAHTDRFGTYTLHDIQVRQNSLNTQASGGSSRELTVTFSPTKIYSTRNYSEPNIFYQAAWTSDGPQFGFWRGVAEFGNQIKDFCNGATNIRITATFNAQGGGYGTSGTRSVYAVTGGSGANSTFIGHCDRGGAFTSSVLTSGAVFDHIRNGGEFMIFSTSTNDYLKVDTGTIRIHITATKTA